MNVSLNPTLESYIKEKMSTGMYNSSSEVIREALRLLKEEDKKKKSLKELLAEGIKDLDEGRISKQSPKEIFEEIAAQNKRI